MGGFHDSVKHTVMMVKIHLMENPSFWMVFMAFPEDLVAMLKYCCHRGMVIIFVGSGCIGDATL